MTFTDCNIYSNTAQSGLGYPPQHGGAFYIVGGTTQVTFTDCNIYQNTAGAVSALAPFGSSNAPLESLN